MNGLDLFSGIGGIGIALEPWVRTVAYCERDRYAQGVLLSRMRSGDVDVAPIWDDVCSLRGSMLPRIDIIFGGFPCQDLSVAGAGKGLAGERSGLFFEIVRLARECEPRFIFLENVPAIRTRGGERVVKELAKIGYDCRWTTLSAAAVGAPHKRDRWFLLAHTKRQRLSKGADEFRNGVERRAPVSFGNSNPSSRIVAHANGVRQLSAQGQYDRISNGCKNVAHSSRPRLERIERIRYDEKQNRAGEAGADGATSKCSDDGICGKAYWAIEPAVGRVVNGLPNRVDRIRCLGNSVVPLQVREAFKKLAGV